MTTARIRWDGKAMTAGPVTLTGPAVHHLRHVIRASTGDVVELLDKTGRLALGTVVAVEDHQVIVDISRIAEPDPPFFRLTMVASPLKRRNTSLLAAKWAELGVFRIVFVPMNRSASTLKEQKRSHLEEVIQEACRAVGQQRIPILELRDRLESVIRDDSCPPLLHLDEESQVLLAQWEPPSCREVCCVLGPEGGMSPAEKELLCRAGSQGVRLLGPAIKAETAGIVGAALILHRAGVL